MKKILIVTMFLVLFLLSGNLTSAQWRLPNPEGLPTSGVEEILGAFLKWGLGIFLILALISFVVSGIMYVTSTGNQPAIDRAKKTMTWSIVGLLVGLSGYIVINTIQELMN